MPGRQVLDPSVASTALLRDTESSIPVVPSPPPQRGPVGKCGTANLSQYLGSHQGSTAWRATPAKPCRNRLAKYLNPTGLTAITGSPASWLGPACPPESYFFSAALGAPSVSEEVSLAHTRCWECTSAAILRHTSGKCLQVSQVESQLPEPSPLRSRINDQAVGEDLGGPAIWQGGKLQALTDSSTQSLQPMPLVQSAVKRQSSPSLAVYSQGPHPFS